MNSGEKRLSQGEKMSADKYWTALAGKYHVAKYVIVVVLVIMIVFMAIFGSGELKAENFRYFFKYLSSRCPLSAFPIAHSFTESVLSFLYCQ